MQLPDSMRPKEPSIIHRLTYPNGFRVGLVPWMERVKRALWYDRRRWSAQMFTNNIAHWNRCGLSIVFPDALCVFGVFSGGKTEASFDVLVAFQVAGILWIPPPPPLSSTHSMFWIQLNQLRGTLRRRKPSTRKQRLVVHKWYFMVWYYVS